MNFTAIDFETGSGRRETACSVSICTIENSKIVDTYTSLICTPDPYLDFEMMNISIHKITPGMVENEPRFDELWEKIFPLLDGSLVVAHSAPFDISVIRALIKYYDLSCPSFQYACTCQMARAAYPDLSDHRLDTVSEHLGIELKHHDAESDTRASALIAIECTKELGKTMPSEIVKTKEFRLETK